MFPPIFPMNVIFFSLGVFFILVIVFTEGKWWEEGMNKTAKKECLESDKNDFGYIPSQL